MLDYKGKLLMKTG
uniref:Uncharacterized protein n=1 Tax=Anguilla anguilla TaxID=7936 RepID=A0A0E9TWX3_ANGAN